MERRVTQPLWHAWLRQKQAGVGYKREFLKEVIDHCVVGKGSVAVFWKLPLRQGAGTRTKEFSIPVRMVEQQVMGTTFKMEIGRSSMASRVAFWKGKQNIFLVDATTVSLLGFGSFIKLDR